jgi:hypothetical protein
MRVALTTEKIMLAGKLLIAALVASGATAGAAQADPRTWDDAYNRTPAPRFVLAPVPGAFHQARHDDDRWVWDRRGRDDYRIPPRGSSPYMAKTDRNGWFLYWQDRYGNVLRPNNRFGPPAPPSPYHQPVVDRNGWFLHWDDMSGDVSTHPLHASVKRNRPDRD